MNALDKVAGFYGSPAREGILSEHVDAAMAAGLVFFAFADDSAWLTDPADDSGDCVRLVCSELEQFDSEDGPFVGRCGEPTIRNKGGDHIWCEAHDMPRWTEDCPHGLSAALCAGPGHYPMDY